MTNDFRNRFFFLGCCYALECTRISVSFGRRKNGVITISYSTGYSAYMRCVQEIYVLEIGYIDAGSRTYMP